MLDKVFMLKSSKKLQSSFYCKVQSPKKKTWNTICLLPKIGKIVHEWFKVIFLYFSSFLVHIKIKKYIPHCRRPKKRFTFFVVAVFRVTVDI